MSSTAQQAVRLSRFARISQVLMASCLGVMAVAVFINVVLRYGFGSGVAASEELSRLLFVWMVFIGATAAYPTGEHMAFNSLLVALRHKPRLRHILAQMSHLGVDSLMIVSLTLLFTGVVISLQTADVLIRFGAQGTLGGIVTIAIGRELGPVLVAVPRRRGAVP